MDSWGLSFLVLWSGMAAILALRLRAYFSARRHHSRDGRKEAVLVALAMVGLAALPLACLAGAFGGWTIGLPGWARWLGALTYAAGLLLFGWVHATLGDCWSPALELKEGHQLVTRGPYARIRHPMYSAYYLFALGQWLLLDNWVAGAGGFLLWTVLYVLRVGREEEMMRDEFGEEYGEYAKNTGRLLPRF